jgi:hypothetical protein
VGYPCFTVIEYPNQVEDSGNPRLARDLAIDQVGECILGSDEGKPIRLLVTKGWNLKRDLGKGFKDLLDGSSDMKMDVYFSDYRVLFNCKKFTKGSFWSGTGLGALVALGAMAVSAGMAKAKRNGKVMAGQVYYDWIYRIDYTRKTGFLSGERLIIYYKDDDQDVWRISLALSSAQDASIIAGQLLAKIAADRLAHWDDLSESERDQLERVIAGQADWQGEQVLLKASFTFQTSYRAPQLAPRHAGELPAIKPVTLGAAPTMANANALAGTPIPGQAVVSPSQIPVATVAPAVPAASGQPKFCTQCGARLAPDAKFCVGCGRPLTKEAL